MSIQGFGRFSEPALLILTCLLDGAPKHGYAISAELDEGFGRHFGPGTLYGALNRLEQRGLIECLPEDGRRRPYRLAADGMAVARHELARLEALTSYAGRMLRLRESRA